MSTDDTVHEAGAEIVAERGGQLVASVSVAAGTITIGRGAASDLVLPDSHVSTRHAEIRTSTSGTAVVDLGSLNGTWIDDVRLPAHQPYYLHDGEQVRIG